MTAQTTSPASQPFNIGSSEMLVERALCRLRSIPSDLEKYTFLMSLKDRREAVFYSLVGANLTELTPLIYTPVIGLACQNFSLIHPPPPVHEGPIKSLYLTANDLPYLPALIANLETRLPKDEMAICVVTDGSRVLGLGDLGIGGMGISMGKLSLYTAGGGVDPRATLPIVLDLGTNNEALLADPLYVGLRQERLSDQDSEAFVDVFMAEMHQYFPNMIIQFEDFRTSLAFSLLAAHREVYPCFNDDIQGTGAVALAGAIRAFSLNSVPLAQQRVLFFGAGSSGVGVAETICRYLQLQGISEEDAKKMFWLVDSKGLVSHNRGDSLQEHKRYLARSEPTTSQLRTLEEVVRFVKPTALMGLSTVGGSFTKEILTYMGEINKTPIVFALSNPVTQAECTLGDAVDATQGRVIFASGSPFDPVTYGVDGGHSKPVVVAANQGNNVYIFPGLGLGAITARVQTIPEELVMASAEALANSLSEDEKRMGMLYPSLTRIREVSVTIAVKVVRAAQRLEVDRQEDLRAMSDSELEEAVRSRMYQSETAF